MRHIARSFFNRVRHIIGKEGVEEAFKQAMIKADFDLSVDGSLVSESEIKFLVIEKKKPPTYDELMSFYKEHGGA